MKNIQAVVTVRQKLKNKYKPTVYLLIFPCLCLLGARGYFAYVKYQFPYGYRPALARNMYFALVRYAEDHEGVFPTDSKEQSWLDAIYPKYTLSPEVISGISGDILSLKKHILEFRRINSKYSSWRYFPGRVIGTQSNVALFYEDSYEVEENGRKNDTRGRIVVFTDGRIKRILEQDWTVFISEQKRTR